jgi:phosphatidylinositol-bisphosphatase
MRQVSIHQRLGLLSALGIPSPDETSLVTPLTSMSVTDHVTMPVEDDLHPNPYLPTFSRPAFLRKRLFGRASKWSEHKDIK